MTALTENNALTSEQPSAAIAGDVASANKRALNLIFGAQKMLLEEMIFVGTEMVDRALTETRLLTEFVSKASGTHSVVGFRKIGEECGQHQINSLRSDWERLFKHSQRTLETASSLLASRAQA